MKPKSSKDMSQLEDMIEYLRKELNSLVVGSEKLYRSEREMRHDALGTKVKYQE